MENTEFEKLYPKLTNEEIQYYMYKILEVSTVFILLKSRHWIFVIAWELFIEI